MGEVADLMLSGVLCCECGRTLDEKVIEYSAGVPVICNDCYEQLPKKEKKNYGGRNEKQILMCLQK